MKTTLPSRLFAQIAVAALVSAAPTASTLAVTPAEVLDHFIVQAGEPADAERGEQLFGTRQGGRWSCASCHGMPPTEAGRHAATGKAIAPLAPSSNGERFTDLAKAEKWFRRNCNDVLGRECTAAEKADVLSWLLSLKP